MPEEPDLVVPAVPVVIVSATVIPSVAAIVFIVGVLPVALLSLCPPCPRPDRRRGHLACRCCCRQHVRLLPPCPPSLSSLSLLSTCPLVAVVSAVAVLLAAVVTLSSHQRSFACCDAFEVKMQQLKKMKTPVWSQAK